MEELTVLGVLDELGDTPDEVRDTLVAHCCYGYPLASGNCPVFNYLKYRGFDIPLEWGVCRGNIYIRDPARDTEFHLYNEFINLPVAVRRFVSDFDEGVYPELYPEQK